VPPAEGAGVGSAPESIARLLQRFPDDAPPAGSAGAAVTILLRQGRFEVETLLIERTERETDPASGQVAFPGGRVEDSDGSMRVTALRELQEEVGLGESDLAGTLRYVGTELAFRFGMTVAVFAAELGSTARTPTPLSVDEVAHVFWLPRSALGSTRSILRETGSGPRAVPATVYEGHILWGFTRRLLRDFYGLPTEGELGGPAFAPDPGRSRTGDADASVRMG
jgi:8-oxo-dGTP pyrophosphatase MutT (NUDIX family)